MVHLLYLIIVICHTGQRLSRLVRQLNCEKVPETVHALLDRHDVHQMASLLEDEAVLKEKVIYACHSALVFPAIPAHAHTKPPDPNALPAKSNGCIFSSLP